jgi:hypothetical protein
MYSYLCPDCQSESSHLTRLKIGAKLYEPCEVCNHPYVVRAICRVATHLSMPEHFNNSTGKYVSNRRAFRSQLDAKSDEMSARLGYDVKYGEVDPSDQKAIGVTSDGADKIISEESNPKQKRAIDKAFS